MKSIMKVLGIVCMIAIFWSCEKEKESISQAEKDFHALINDHRTVVSATAVGFPVVIWEKAREHSVNIVNGTASGHSGFEEREQYLKIKIGAKEVKEIVLVGNGIKQEDFDEMMSIQSNKAIIEGDFVHCAVGIRSNSDQDFFYTIIFVRM